MIADPVLRMLPERDFSAPVRMIGTLALVAAGLFSRELMGGWLANYPLLMFIPSVFFAALLFGARFGILATLMSVASAVYFFIAPRYSFAIGWSAAVPVLIFTLICLMQCAVIAALRTAVRKLLVAERKNSLLYAELHHRTRNDLSMVSSSLELRARATTSTEARHAYEFAVRQVLAIAASQGRLQGSGQADIDLELYLSEICHGFRAILDNSRPIEIGLHSDPLAVSHDVAVTIGLIVNELVTNALKYAFPDGRPGTIGVVVHGGDTVAILVEDDGVGTTSDMAGGMGTRLIASLVRPYNGQVERVPNARGYSVRVTLVLPRPGGGRSPSV